MRVVTLRTGLAAIVAGVLVWTAPGARAQVTITQEPGRPSLLYSSDSDLNCSDLSVLVGDSLPYNVVRLRAPLPAGADRIEWSLPKPEVGFLLADQDLTSPSTFWRRRSPAARAAAIRVVADLCTLGIALVIGYYGWKLTAAATQITATLKIPHSVVYIVVPASAALVFVHTLGDFVRNCRAVVNRGE